MVARAALVLLTLLASPLAQADLPASASRPAGVRGPRDARSVGAPHDGRLVDGRRLRESKTLRYLASTAPRGRHFGTEELVDVLRRGAEAVDRARSSSVLRVGDLSARGGGEVHMHASHESGRDADVAFYLRAPDGADATPAGYVAIGPEGTSSDGSLVFDDERNWLFVEAILGSRRATVTHVFVADHLRQRLLEAARVAGASEAVIRRAASVLSQPRGSFAHDNHFHVRVACAPTDRPDCIEGARRHGR